MSRDRKKEVKLPEIELMSHSASPSTWFSTTGKRENTLLLAAAKGNVEEIKLLAERKTLDPNETNKAGHTPLFKAVQNEHTDAAQALLEGKWGCPINIDTKCGPSQLTALMVAVKTGNAAIVTLLLEHDADTTLTNKGGQTALQLAQKKPDQNAEIIKVLEAHVSQPSASAS